MTCSNPLLAIIEVIITNYFVILTRACNLKCKYCGEDITFEPPPIDLAYPITDLYRFLEQDSGDVTIQFYGGEPLLRIPLLQQIMDQLPFVHKWSVQTNATFLHKLPEPYLHRLDSILVSIDGRKHVNDINRGKGNYDTVLENCRIIREKGYSGDLIARMAVSEAADIYEEVTHLLDLTNPAFNHVHWQLDSQWDDDPNARWSDFNSWVDNSYNPGISKLVKRWAVSLKQGEVLGIVPFIPIMKSLLFDIPSDIRCGAGTDSFAINPDGSISVCPISPEFAFSVVGHIDETPPETIRNRMKVSEPCPACSIYAYCGGRCLFSNKTKLWGDTGFQKVCSTVHHLISELSVLKPLVQDLLNGAILTKDAFDYPDYNNGCEIIP